MGLKKEHINIYASFDLEWYSSMGNEIMVGVVGIHAIFDVVMRDLDIVFAYDFHNESQAYKPLFRRLSQILKTITHNGETFIPTERIAVEGFEYVKYDKVKGYAYKEIGKKKLTIGYLNPDVKKWPYEYLVQLAAMHFDIFSYIDSRDASVKKDEWKVKHT